MVLILQVVGASSLGQGASVRFGTWVLVEDAVPDVYGLVSFGLWALMPLEGVAYSSGRFEAWALVPLQGAAGGCR